MASIVDSMLGARVERERAERFRKELAALHLVDKTRSIVDDGSFVVIPLIDAPGPDLLKRHGATGIEMSFPSRKSMKDPIDQILERVELPNSLKPMLPHKWEQFGDVLVLRLDPALDRFEVPVAQAYAEVLRAKTVLRDVGGISGDYRQPVVRTIVGSDTVATHIEGGIKYKFDVARVMFSSGNQEERARMANLNCGGETVVDMFAGIGYFSLPLAVHQDPKRVVACELNPIAHSYLVENIGLNGVEGLVEPVLGDNRELPGESFADRIIMGYVRTTHEFLPTAVRIIKDGGLIHFHETCPNELLPQRPVQHVVDGARGCKVVVERMKEIKSYAPGVSHVVVDARIFKPS